MLQIFCGRAPHIAACFRLVNECFGQNCQFWLSSFGCPSARLDLVLFLKARRAVMGPAKRGPIWAGQGTQPINAHPEGVCIWVPRRSTHYRSRFFFFVVARPLAFGSLPARIMPTLRVGIWKNVPFFHYKSRLFIRAYIYREGTTKVVINRTILAKNNVLAWKFREWNFVKIASARKGTCRFTTKLLNF